MCKLVSWTELDGQNYFLTKKELRTKRGKELREYLGNRYYDDVKGHGAIDFYYKLRGQGDHRECTDFSDPNNFPPEIVSALKNGAFEGIGLDSRLLNSAARTEYEKARDAARAEYKKAYDAALAEHEKAYDAAFEKARVARAEYEKAYDAAFEKARDAARAEYEKACDAAWTKYEKARDAARAECEKTIMSAFWDLFRDPENRAEAWR